VLPSGATYVAPIGGWQITKSLTVRGEGPGTSGFSGATITKPYDQSNPVFVIVPPASMVFIHDLDIVGTTGSTGAGGVGIKCVMDGTHDASVDIGLRRLTLSGLYNHGIHVEGYGASTYVDGLHISDCAVGSCGGAGVYLKKVRAVYVSGLRCQSNGLSGLAADTCEVIVSTSTFDGNCTTTSDSSDGNVKLADCVSGQVEASRFLNLHVGSVKKGIVVNGGMAVVGTCYFEAAPGSGTAGSGIVVTNAGPVTILGNRFKKITTLVDIGSNTNNCWLVPQFSEDSSSVMTLPSTNVGMIAVPSIIRSTGSTVSGVIIPGGSSNPTQSIREGMIAYNTTTNQLMVRMAGGTWKKVDTTL